MKNVLVTGGAGFIGSNFIRHILSAETDIRVVNLDALTYAGSLENLREVEGDARYSFVQGNIKDQTLVEQLLQARTIDTVVHFAAESHVDRSILGPRPFMETNMMGTFFMLEAVRKIWLEQRLISLEDVRFHHISTDEVFGSLASKEPAWTEESLYAPSSPYAASKAASDHLVRSYGQTYGLPYTVTNCSNNYGPYQFPEKMIPLMILNALEGKPLPVYGDGGHVRDWLHVADHCEAIQLVLTKGSIGSTYNIGGGNQPANVEIVEMICGILDEMLPDSAHKPYKNLIRFVRDRPGHDRRYALDTSRITHDLGWRPRFSFAEGLASVIHWYLSHPEWVAAIRHQQEYQGWLNTNYRSR